MYLKNNPPVTIKNVYFRIAQQAALQSELFVVNVLRDVLEA